MSSLKSFKYFCLVCVGMAVSLSACLFDAGGDKITGRYSTDWIDVHSNRGIEVRNSDDMQIQIVAPYVFAVGHNQRFIIAKQHPLVGKFPNEMIDKAQTNYFLVDLKLNQADNSKGIFGPVSASQFDRLNRHLKVGRIEFDLTYPESP